MNKAEKSQIIVLIACFACVFLSAALIWNYYKKPADENEALIVTIKYPEYENAVITPVSTMECAIDNEFLHELQQISSSSDGNTDEHSYNYQYDTVPDRIYIKAPDIYVFEQGKSKSSMTPCSVGSIAYYDDAPWFSISTTIQRETKLFLGADNEETAELTVPMYDFGDWASRMKAYRKKNHITQQELAQLMGVKHFTLRSWEQKQAKPPYNVWRLHKHLFDDSIKLT